MFKIDLTYLENISAGDKAFVAEMLAMLKKNTIPEIHTLKQSVGQKDWEKARASAHKMKAPIEMLGVPPVSTLIMEIEQSTKEQKDLETLPSKVSTLETHLAELDNQLTQQIEELKK
jgi:HPt (histidine-containing phosphotransfer) domain-containing protein